MMLRPAPFPEELDRGYLGRLMRLNGLTSPKDAIVLMSQWAGVSDKSRCEVSCVELLSKAAGIDLSLFVRQHTTIPLRRAITGYQSELPHGSEESKSLLWTIGMRVTRAEAYFCPKCIEEDLDFHGQSFWRRGHQIPGLHCCQQHAVPLRYVEGEVAFLSPPSKYVQQSLSDEALSEGGYDQNSYIRKYLDICSGLMERGAPLNVKNVSAILKERASELGYQTPGDSKNGALLSDSVIEAFGKQWLANVLPEIVEKPTGEIMRQMDVVIFLKNSVSSLSVYILACAYLFATADDALNILHSKQIYSRKKRQLNTKIDHDELINAYVQARGQHSSVAELLSIQRQVVVAQLKQLGLPNLLVNSKVNYLKAATAFYVDKKSTIQSAALGHISVDAMDSLVRRAGYGLTNLLVKIARLNILGSVKDCEKEVTPADVKATEVITAINNSQDISPVISTMKIQKSKMSPKIHRHVELNLHT